MKGKGARGALRLPQLAQAGAVAARIAAQRTKVFSAKRNVAHPMLLLSLGNKIGRV